MPLPALGVFHYNNRRRGETLVGIKRRGLLALRRLLLEQHPARAQNLAARRQHHEEAGSEGEMALRGIAAEIRKYLGENGREDTE